MSPVPAPNPDAGFSLIGSSPSRSNRVAGSATAGHSFLNKLFED
jgi:hypothetical protein